MNDYQLAKELVGRLKMGETEAVKPEKKEYFRRYLGELSLKSNMKFATKPTDDGKLLVKRIKKEKIW